MNAIQWSYFSMISGIVLQVVFAAIYSRLLTKEQFGIVATAFILQRFGQFITDLGVGQALVQKPDLEREDVQSAFTIALVLGALVTLGMWLLAPVATRFFGNPALLPIFQGYSLTYVISGAAIVSASLLRRQLQFRPLVISELTAYVVGHGVLGLGSAYLGYGAFSLVISALAQAVIQLVILYSAARHSLQPMVNVPALRRLFGFSTRATAVNFLEFLSGSLDGFVIAKFYNPAQLGLYDRTFKTLGAPAINFASSLTRVLASSFSAIQYEPERLRRSFLSALRAMSLVIFSIAGCIVVDAEEIVKVLLGGNFLEGIGLMQIFAIYVPFLVLANLSGILAEATARLNLKIVIQIVHFLAFLAALIVTYRLGGTIQDIAVVLVVGMALKNAAFAALARRIIGTGGKEIVATHLLGAACGVGAAGVSALVVLPLRHIGTPLPALFVVELLLGAAIVAGVILFGPPSELKRIALETLTKVSGRLPGRLRTR